MKTRERNRQNHLEYTMLSGILDLVFPPRCVACRTLLAHGKTLCEPCRKTIALHTTFFCGACRRRLPTTGQSCHRDFPYALGAATDYDGVMKHLVHALKFDLVQGAGEELGCLLADYAVRTSLVLEDALLVPIPLSKRRERERGFNQATLIAISFAERFGLRLSAGAMRRIRHTPAQSKTASLHERANNIAGCFSAEPALVRGRDLILVDDVVTSGATLLEAAKILKKAGAGTIVGLVAAKTDLRNVSLRSS